MEFHCLLCRDEIGLIATTQAEIILIKAHSLCEKYNQRMCTVNESVAPSGCECKLVQLVRFRT